jgi:hypothetical protein
LKKRATRTSPRVCGKGIGPLKEGELGQFGYHTVSSLPSKARHAMLAKAVAQYGALSLFRKLNAISIYTRRSSPGSSAIFLADRDWIREQYMKKK